MFAGIVEESAVVRNFDRSREPHRLVVSSGLDHSETQLGDSIAIDGCCLTVVKKEKGELSFDVSAETVRRSTMSGLQVGSKVNLERSLSLGSRIHGHLVSGHVDAAVKLLSRTNDGNCDRYAFELPAALRPFIATKGSISVSGISLTVGEIDDSSFCVYIVPHTASVTTLTSLQPGARVNIEVDMLARYVVNALASRSNGVTEDFLRENGFMGK
jgi:riboflavin synthase